MSNISNNITDVFHAITASKPSSQLREELTQAEVASIMGLTRCGVQQIEARALEKLRKALKKRNIKELQDVV
jgi:DNA-directed RNA polymerase sigma subunit (sigma70/sigma32)